METLLYVLIGIMLMRREVKDLSTSYWQQVKARRSAGETGDT